MLGNPTMSDLMTVAEVAAFFRVNPKSIYRRPARYGCKKIKGVGFRAPRQTVENIAGIRREQ